MNTLPKLRFPQNYGIPLKSHNWTTTDLETALQFISFLPTFSSLTKSNSPLLMSIEEATNDDILTLQISIRVYMCTYTVCKKSISGLKEKSLFPSQRPNSWGLTFVVRFIRWTGQNGELLRRLICIVNRGAATFQYSRVMRKSPKPARDTKQLLKIKGTYFKETLF